MTMLWTASDLVRAAGGTFRARFDACGVSIDTRSLRPGELFVALRGERGDGHDFVRDALTMGAAGAIVHRDAEAGPLLRVKDTLEGLQGLGAYGRNRFGGRLVAITGSVGKTTTKEMLRTILSAQGAAHAAEASHNNHWGVPLTLARLPADCRYCVIEIGMNHAGEIEPLARLARPHVAVITAIEPTHIGHLGSLDAIAEEKASILRGLEPDGIAVLPAESGFLPRLQAEANRVVTFGMSECADARLLGADLHPSGSELAVRIADHHFRFWLHAPGQHMALNAVAALAAAAALGADPAVGARALEQEFRPLTGRGTQRRIKLAGGEALLLDESYNASSASVRAALAVLRLQRATRRLAVLGDMLELGDEAPAEHAGLAQELAETADQVFACGPLMRHLIAALPAGLPAQHTADSAALAPIVANAVRPGDAVLIKGSLGSRMRLIVSALETGGY